MHDASLSEALLLLFKFLHLFFHQFTLHCMYQNNTLFSGSFGSCPEDGKSPRKQCTNHTCMAWGKDRTRLLSLSSTELSQMTVAHTWCCTQPQSKQ